MSNDLKWYDLDTNEIKDVARCSVSCIGKGSLSDIDEDDSLYELGIKVDSVELKVDFEGLGEISEIMLTVPANSVSVHDEFEIRIIKTKRETNE